MAIHRNKVSTNQTVVKQPMITRMKNSIHKTEAKVSSKVHKPMIARAQVHNEVKPKRVGLRQHRLNKKQAKLPKQNVGIIGRLRLMINRLMNFTKVKTNKMITAGSRPIVQHNKQPKHF